MNRVRIPADVEREDRILAGLTGRQLLILAPATIALWAAFAASRRVVSPLLFAVLALPFAFGALTLALGRLDGLGADRLAWAALRQRRAPRRLVPSADEAGSTVRRRGKESPNRLGRLELPARSIDDRGIVDLGRNGYALICSATWINFGLRSPEEQAVLVGAFARFLNSVGTPLQIVVRAERADLSQKVSDLRHAAATMPHAALTAAALEHAGFLEALAESREVFRSRVLVIFREPRSASQSAGILRRRAEDARTALAAAGITLTPLSAFEAYQVLARAADPELSRQTPPSGSADRIVTAQVATAPGTGRSGESYEPHLPDSVEVLPKSLRVGEHLCRTFATTGYPREVGPGWLEPVLGFGERAEVALHIDPIPPELAAYRLRRQRARLESSRRLDAERGMLADPDLEVAVADAHDLAGRLARGEGRLFRVGLYVTLWAQSEAEVEQSSRKLRALMASLLLQAHPASWRSLQGWVSTLPLCLDSLGIGRTFDTQALAAAFPFASAESQHSAGVLYGKNSRTSGLVLWDRFAQPNYNSVILARSGAGKSYLAKLEALRSLYAGVRVLVIDPEDEYRRMAEAVGGTCVGLGAAGCRLNPFELGQEPDALVRRGLFIHTLVGLLLGAEPPPAARAALDRAIVGAYSAAGITSDPGTHRLPAPVMSDLQRALKAQGDRESEELAERLAPFVSGTFRSLFDGPSTVQDEGQLVVFSLRRLPEELKGAGTLVVLDAIWRQLSDAANNGPKLVLIDEAWLLMRDPRGARFLFRLAKSARKLWCGLTVVTQDAGDLLESELGRAVVANAATQILLRQAPQALSRLVESFDLSEGERAFLAGARPGEGLLIGGADRVGFRALASPAEHRLITTDPAELARED